MTTLEVVERLSGTLKPKRWFPSTGTPYGVSFLFRSLVHLCRTTGRTSLRDKLRKIGERLLRHVEVRRQDALKFDRTGLPDDASVLMEHLRFTIGMLEMARLFQDTRFFNAALKMNDWHYRKVRRLSLPSRTDPVGMVPILIVLHYVQSITEQEKLMVECFGS